MATNAQKLQIIAKQRKLAKAAALQNASHTPHPRQPVDGSSIGETMQGMGPINAHPRPIGMPPSQGGAGKPLNPVMYPGGNLPSRKNTRGLGRTL